MVVVVLVVRSSGHADACLQQQLTINQLLAKGHPTSG